MLKFSEQTRLQDLEMKYAIGGRRDQEAVPCGCGCAGSTDVNDMWKGDHAASNPTEQKQK